MPDLPEIEVKAMPQEDAEAAFGISKWGTWGCGVSKFGAPTSSTHAYRTDTCSTHMPPATNAMLHSM